MSTSRPLLQHFLAALAYRTQKALREAPSGFSDFRAGTNVLTPHELVWHMTGVIGYARTMLRGGDFAPPKLDSFDDEVVRFHTTLAMLRRLHGSPVPSENFIHAAISATNVSESQPAPVAPDTWWRPDQPPLPPAPDPLAAHGEQTVE